jgi:type II secretory pathway component PulK
MQRRATRTSSTARPIRTSVRPRRGSVVVIVIWAIAIAAVLVAGTQLIAFRQATTGREAVARVQARWAARAGIEETLAVLEYHSSKPNPDDAMEIYRDLEAVADGTLTTGDWTIRHSEDGREVPGPQDENAKANVVILDRTGLLGLDRMSFDVADSIIDYRDEDNEVTGLGAERDYYIGRGLKPPRNAPFRTIAELERVAGAFPEYVRGEDANLNGRLDPNEDDGSLSPPNDDADGLLDAGWSAYLTTYSTSSNLTPSGQPKLFVQRATPEELTARLGVDEAQAKALQQYAGQPNARMELLLVTDLGRLSSGNANSGRGGSAGGGRSGRSSSGMGSSSGSGRNSGGSSRGGSNTGGANAGGATNVTPLSNDQLRAIFREATFTDPKQVTPGKINVNTAPPDVLRRLLGIDSYMADGIVALRQSRQGGISSIVDLLESNRITPQDLAGLASKVDVSSQVFTITSRGRSESTGLEVEITAVVDRSTIPARILEYREQ